MITKQVINELYKKYRKRLKKTSALPIGDLMLWVGERHDLQLTDDGCLLINSLDEYSPFRSIPLDRIHGIVPFEKSVAVVLPSSIIFLNRYDSGVHVHIKPNPVTVWEKVRWWFHKE